MPWQAPLPARLRGADRRAARAMTQRPRPGSCPQWQGPRACARSSPRDVDRRRATPQSLRTIGENRALRDCPRIRVAVAGARPRRASTSMHERRSAARVAAGSRCRGHAHAGRRAHRAHRRLPAGAARRSRGQRPRRGARGMARACRGVLEATVAAMSVPARRSSPGSALRSAASLRGGRATCTMRTARPIQHAPRTSRRCAKASGSRTLPASRGGASPRGVTRVAGGAWCTYTDAERFFSYRREKGERPDGARGLARGSAHHEHARSPSSSQRSPAASSPPPPPRSRSRCPRRGSRGSCRSRSARCSAPCSSSSCRTRSRRADASAVMATVLAGLLAFFLLEKLVLWRHSHGHDAAPRRRGRVGARPRAARARARRRPLGPHDPHRQQRAQLLRRHRHRRRVPRRRAARRRDDGCDRRARRAAAGRRLRRAHAFRLHARRAPSPSTWPPAWRRSPARCAGYFALAGMQQALPSCSPSRRRACSMSRWPTSSRACIGVPSRSRPRGRCSPIGLGVAHHRGRARRCSRTDATRARRDRAARVRNSRDVSARSAQSRNLVAMDRALAAGAAAWLDWWQRSLGSTDLTVPPRAHPRQPRRPWCRPTSRRPTRASSERWGACGRRRCGLARPAACCPRSSSSPPAIAASAGEAWHEQPYFSLLRQSYLLYARIPARARRARRRCPPQEKQRLEFATRQYLDAIAPTNFPATNPEVLQRARRHRRREPRAGLAQPRRRRAHAAASR